MPPPANFLCLELLIDFFRGCCKYGPIIRKIIDNVQFAVQKEIFQNILFLTLPLPTLGSVAQSTLAWKL